MKLFDIPRGVPFIFWYVTPSTPALAFFVVPESPVQSRGRDQMSDRKELSALDPPWLVRTYLSICVDIGYRGLASSMFPFVSYVHLFPPSLQWVPWPAPCGSPTVPHLRRYYGSSVAHPSVCGRLRSPLAAAFPLV